MRLMRMGCRLSLFGSVIAIPVTWIFLSEGDGSLRFRLDGQRGRGQRPEALGRGLRGLAQTLHTLYDVIRSARPL